MGSVRIRSSGTQFLHAFPKYPPLHVLPAADITLNSRVGVTGVCQSSEISICRCCVYFQSRCPHRGHRDLRAEGPPTPQQQQWISSHITHSAEAPRKWKLLHSPHSLQPQGYVDNWIWRPNKINQYRLSLGYFWGLWKGQSAYFSVCVFCSCEFTWRQQHPKSTDTCNPEFIDCLWFVFLCERSILPANRG